MSDGESVEEDSKEEKESKEGGEEEEEEEQDLGGGGRFSLSSMGTPTRTRKMSARGEKDGIAMLGMGSVAKGKRRESRVEEAEQEQELDRRRAGQFSPHFPFLPYIEFELKILLLFRFRIQLPGLPKSSTTRTTFV